MNVFANRLKLRKCLSITSLSLCRTNYQQIVSHTGVIRKASFAPHVKLQKLIKVAGPASAAGAWITGGCVLYSPSCQFDSRGRRRYTTYRDFGAWCTSFFWNNGRSHVVSSVFWCERLIVARAVPGSLVIVLQTFLCTLSG